MNELIYAILGQMSMPIAQREFLQLFFPTLLFLRTKFNFRNLSRYMDFCEKTISRHFRKPFDFLRFNLLACHSSLPPNATLLAGIDPSYIPKSGHSTEGLGYFFDSSLSIARKGLEVSLVALFDFNASTAYALSSKQTPPGKPKKNKESKKNSASKTKKKSSSPDEKTRLDFYLKHFLEVISSLPKTVKYSICDGFFAKKKWVKGVTPFLHVISKLRHDANLRYLYNGEQKARGAKRKYGGKVYFEALEGFQNEGFVDRTIELYSAVVYSIAFQRQIKVVQVRRWKNGSFEYVLLFSTDLEQQASEIYLMYKCRFQMEFLFRDAKQHFGLTDCQSPKKEALEYHWNSSFAALNIAKLEMRNEMKTDDPISYSIASFKQKAWNEHLLYKIFYNLGFDLTSIKFHPLFRSLRNYGVIAS